MKQWQLSEFTKGWFIGQFQPHILYSEAAEVAIKRYTKGDKENRHHHKIAQEVTAIVSGKFRMGDRVLDTDDIVLISPGESVDFECLESGVTVVVKLPSVLGDKYEDL